MRREEINQQANIGMHPMLPVLNQILPTKHRQCHRPLSADLLANRLPAMDGLYDTRKCHEAIAARDAMRIPPRKNGQARKPLFVAQASNCRQ